jgi:hypothetical protein
MTPQCDAVAERTALGESLGELAEHVAGCARCQRVVAMPGQLGATHHEIDPGLGFSARMTVGAQQRIAVRRRRRLAAGLAASVAAGALGVVVMTRAPDAPAPVVSVQLPEVKQDPPAVPLDESDLQVLVGLSDTGRTTRMSARWNRIEKPLAPYRKLMKRLDTIPVESPEQAPAEGSTEGAEQGVTP